jgi:hypothetical protein
MSYLQATRLLAFALGSVVLAAGCDRAVEELKHKAIGAATRAASDKVSEVVTEKVMEASLEKSGMKNVKADLGTNGNKLSLTDKDGKTVSMASGNAVPFSEADFGVPFYPGAKVDDTKSVKLVSGEAFQYSMTMQSGEKFDKVSAFYRDKLKAAAGKRQYNEMAEGVGKVILMLVDESKNGSLIAVVEAPEGENVSITLAKQGSMTAKPAAPTPPAAANAAPAAK